MRKIQWFEEPKLKFTYGQNLKDPRDGLTRRTSPIITILLVSCK